MDYKQVNDYEVLYMIKENDDDSRNLILKKYMPVIRKIAWKYCDSSQIIDIEMEDLVQEGLISLNRCIDSFKESENVTFYSYASVCIERGIISYCRKFKRKKNFVFNNLDYEYDISSVQDMNSYLIDIEEKLFNREEFSRIKYSLDFETSLIFELRFNGFSYREISTLLNCSSGFISSRLNRIRKALVDI